MNTLQLQLLLDASKVTLGLALVSLFVGLLLAILFCAAEMQKKSLISKAVSLLVTVLRGLPEILVVFFVFYGGTHFLFLLTNEFYNISPFWSGVLALSLIFAAYASQTLRAAIQSVPAGQQQAAQALGMGPLRCFLRIVLPQAWRLALPGLGNQWMVLLKDTALVSLIGVTDLMKQADLLSGSTYKPFTFLIVAAGIYLFITVLSQWLLKHIERYLNRSNPIDSEVTQ